MWVLRGVFEILSDIIISHILYIPQFWRKYLPLLTNFWALYLSEFLTYWGQILDYKSYDQA